MPALALLAGDDNLDVEGLEWRALNANRLLGAVDNGETCVHAATMPGHTKRTRLEAIAILAEWAEPHGQDRVFGNWRPCAHEKSQRVALAFAGLIPEMLQDPVIAEAVANAAGKLRLTTCSPDLAALRQHHHRQGTRPGRSPLGARDDGRGRTAGRYREHWR